MIASLILLFISLFPFLVNVSFATWIACRSRRIAKPSLLSITLLFSLGVAPLVWFLTTNTAPWTITGAPWTITVLTVLSMLCCILHALALAAQRWVKLRVWSSWILATLVLVPLIAWIDLRFRVIVVETDGSPVETEPKAIYFHRPPQTYLHSYEYGYGHRWEKGEIYFGFCQWFMYGKDWRIWGALLKRGPAMTNGKPGITDGGWSQWPIRIVIPPEAP